MRLFALAAFTSVLCSAQPPAGCQPSTLNIPGAKFPCVNPDRSAVFRVVAPDAQKVQLRLGKPLDMVKGPDGAWAVTTPPLVEGFHYYSFSIDGATAADPYTRTFFGSGWDNSAIEIPEASGGEYYQPQDVPHGQVSQRWYFSKVTGKWRRCYVYTPPDYDAGKTRYPVLYLLHGWGENEQGWHLQGHADFILDNLIAAKKARPMIIVMDNLNAVKPGEDGTIFSSRWFWPPAPPSPEGQPARRLGLAGFTGATFTEMMLTDLIPMVEKTYRVLPGRENRAMAGLSMGGMQTFQVTFNHLDLFSYIGGFSGAANPFMMGNSKFDTKTAFNGAMADPAAFAKRVHLLWIGVGTNEPERMKSGLESLHNTLDEAKIQHVFYESPGTDHEWQTWRRDLKDFAPRLFQSTSHASETAHAK